MAVRLGLIPRMMGIAGVAVCLAAMGGVVCAQQQGSGTPNEKAVLRGTVVNSVTHEPVGRAVVMTQDGRFATMTNDRGQFEMRFKEKKSAPAPNGAPGIEGGGSTFTRTFTSSDGSSTTTTYAPGVSVQPGTVDRPDFLTARRTGYLNMVLRGNPGVAIARDQEEVTISLTPEARIVGRVTLADGEGAKGMQVALYRRMVQRGRAQWQPSGQAEVKSDGEFRMAELEAGEYKLFSLELNDRDPVTSNPRGQQFGYPPDYFPGAADFGSAALIHLAAGETFQASLTPERRPYYPISIGVGNGAQRGGVVPQVEVWKDGHPGPGYALGYDFRNGTIGGALPDGNYLVKVTGGNDNSLTGLTNLTVHGGPAGGTVTLLGGSVVTVEVSEEFSNSEQNRAIVMAQPAGDPSNPQRRARRGSGIQFMLWSAEDFTFRRQLMAQPPSDPDAEGLEIANVPAGEYRVQIEAPVGYVASVQCGGTDLLKSNLVVTAGGTLPPIEVVLRDDGGEVDGTVAEIASRNRTNLQGAVPAYVYFLPEEASAGLKLAFVQANGEFHMAQLAPGTYRVVAFETSASRRDLEYSNEEVMKKYGAQTVTLEPGQKEKIRISLSAE